MDHVWVVGIFSSLSITKNEQQNLKTDCFTWEPARGETVFWVAKYVLGGC